MGGSTNTRWHINVPTTVWTFAAHDHESVLKLQTIHGEMRAEVFMAAWGVGQFWLIELLFWRDMLKQHRSGILKFANYDYNIHCWL